MNAGEAGGREMAGAWPVARREQSAPGGRTISGGVVTASAQAARLRPAGSSDGARNDWRSGRLLG